MFIWIYKFTHTQTQKKTDKESNNLLKNKENNYFTNLASRPHNI